MGTLVILDLPVRKESVVELQAYLKEIFPQTRGFDGNESINAYLGEDGKTITLVQNWVSPEHYQRYLAWRQETGVFDKIMAMLEGEPGMRFLSEIDA